ncbi:hypothetical protein GSI_04644 [Ganoderma sinense ZZ0214-1]|uniref:F-box domain-containing protein n=1 Tax=Ganoderma sinense ZZ0214-1 TaxID=1077348 RepID=A0A2G8SHE2_9APHY|nr:hypothetical protein GSI_04644 [Ganoderma sinense ZZ0214-1]
MAGAWVAKHDLHMSFHEAVLALLTERLQIHPLRSSASPVTQTSQLLRIPMVGIQVDSLPFPGLASSLPIADRANLVGLNDNEVRAWSAAKADEYRRFALALLSIYNAVAPIHRLPVEILSNIFERCWTGRNSLRIGHVCRRWRSVLLRTTQFWADAVAHEQFAPSRHSVGYLGATLERSAPRNVELSCSRFWGGFSRSVVSHSGRTMSLAVTVGDGSQLVALWNCLTSGMHQLQTLAVTFDLDADPDHRSWTSDPRVEPLSAAAVPRLTRVTAPAVLLPSLSVPSLQHITLENLYGRYSPEGRLASYEGLCEALAVCAASLETLVLLDVGPRAYHSPSGSPTTTSSSTILLPALRHLRIADTTRRCALLLARLAFPDTTHINCVNVDNGALCATLPASSACIDARLSATDRVAIRSTADATSVHCLAGPDGRELLCVGLAGVRRGLRPDDLVQLFRQGARVTHLTVAGLDGRDVLGVEFRAFPRLVRLDVSGEMAGYILQNLARRDSDGDAGDLDRDRGQANVVCPGLETLAVDFHFALGAVKGDLGTSLRHGDVSVVEADLRRRCADLGRVLSQRAQMGGSNVRRLEFGCTEQGWPVGSLTNERKCTPALQVGPSGSNSNWASWRPIVKPLEKLVDGPVVFTGYHFFPASDQRKVQHGAATSTY